MQQSLEKSGLGARPTRPRYSERLDVAGYTLLATINNAACGLCAISTVCKLLR